MTAKKLNEIQKMTNSLSTKVQSNLRDGADPANAIKVMGDRFEKAINGIEAVFGPGSIPNKAQVIADGRLKGENTVRRLREGRLRSEAREKTEDSEGKRRQTDRSREDSEGKRKVTVDPDDRD